jgi:hypothetical protein
VYQIDCTTPEQIASSLFLLGADIRASFEAGQYKDMGKGRVVFDMGGTNAGAVVIQYDYPVCHTPDVGLFLGDDWILVANTPENRKMFADAWLASNGQVDLDMVDVTNPDGSPVYTTPDGWYGVFRMDGEEYFPVNGISEMHNALHIPGDVEITTVQHEPEGTWLAGCYKTVSPVYNIPVAYVSGDEQEDALFAIMTIGILNKLGR